MDGQAAESLDDKFAASLRGFGPLSIAASLLILVANGIWPIRGAAVLAWAALSRTPLRELGYVRPRSWLATIAGGIAFGVAFKLFMKSVFMPLLGAPDINPAYHFIAGNAAAAIGMSFMVTIAGGFGEETLYRGWMFERLGKLIGSRAAIVVITSAIFALAHYPEQGLAGAEQAAVVGLTFGAIFAVTRSISMLMIAHAAFDIAAIALVYFNAERAAAHMFFS